MSRGQSDHGTIVEHPSEEQSTEANASAPIERQTYDIVADLRVSGPDLLLADALRSVPEMTVEPKYGSASDAGQSMFIVATGGDFDRFEAALAEDPSVSSPVRVSESADERIYRVMPARKSPVLPSAINVEARVREGKLDAEGWHLRMQFVDREDLVAFNSYCRTHGMDPQVVRLCGANDEGSCDIPGLTEDQFHLLQSAYAGGYYEMPREVSQEDLAETFDISPSGVSQRLRRATSDLVASMLDTGYCR